MTHNWVKNFEDNWKDIYQEYLSVKHFLKYAKASHLTEGVWDQWPLFAWPDGKQISNTARCPKTAKIIQQNFPNGHGVVAFSKIGANSYIKPHTGVPANFLRAHLGLIVPEGDCAIKVKDDVYNWQEGKILIFDDRLMHEVWNRTPYDRVVLLFDFYEPH